MAPKTKTPAAATTTTTTTMKRRGGGGGGGSGSGGTTKARKPVALSASDGPKRRRKPRQSYQSYLRKMASKQGAQFDLDGLHATERLVEYLVERLGGESIEMSRVARRKTVSIKDAHAAIGKVLHCGLETDCRDFVDETVDVYVGGGGGA